MEDLLLGPLSLEDYGDGDLRVGIEKPWEDASVYLTIEQAAKVRDFLIEWCATRVEGV